jgi:hypothetical protein
MHERSPCEMLNNKFAVNQLVILSSCKVYSDKDNKWRFSKFQGQLHCEILSDGKHHVLHQSQIKSTLHTTTTQHDFALKSGALSTSIYVPSTVSDEVTSQTTLSAPQPVKSFTSQPIDIPACTSSSTTSGVSAYSENTIFQRNVDTLTGSMKSSSTNADTIPTSGVRRSARNPRAPIRLYL